MSSSTLGRACCSCSESYSDLPPAEALEAEGGAEVELATDEWLVSSFFYQVGVAVNLNFQMEGEGGAEVELATD